MVPETDMRCRVRSLSSPSQMIAFRWSINLGAQLHPSTPPLDPRAAERPWSEHHSVSHTKTVWTISCSCSNMTVQQHKAGVHENRDEGVQGGRTCLACTEPGSQPDPTALGGVGAETLSQAFSLTPLRLFRNNGQNL